MTITAPNILDFVTIPGGAPAWAVLRWKKALSDPANDIERRELEELMNPLFAQRAYVFENQLHAAKAVQQTVETAINYTIDQKDTWQTAAQTALRKRGDCEDIAILKYVLLRKLSYNDVYCILCWDRIRRIHHMITVVYYDDKWYCLDNGRDVTEMTEALEYQLQFAFQGNSNWIYGKRVDADG